MRKFWEHYKIVIAALVVWRVVLAVIDFVSPYVVPPRIDFLNSIRWANMDGGHYLYIAHSGYGLYEQAFFPFYPLLIRAFSFLPIAPAYIGIMISHVAFFFGILLYYDLAQIVNKKNAIWAVIGILSFPTSFFFVSVYPTSVFFLFSVSAILSIEKRQWFIAGLAGLFGSFTRIFGIFLVFPAAIEYMRSSTKIKLRDLLCIGLIPMGLATYMMYLYFAFGDAFSFIHVLPAFGSQRSSGQIILLPQVFWRYLKIFIRASPTTIAYGVAAFECITFIFFLYLLVRAFQFKLKVPYILYSAIVLVMPTLTGTLTSMPRYVLAAFPLFIVMGSVHNRRVKIALLVLMSAGLVVCTSLYLQGYFIA